MTALAYYLLKVLICSGVLFLYYHLALKDKAFHHWNRFYLLSTVVLSLLLPLLQFNVISNPKSNTDAVQIIQAVQSADTYLEGLTVTASPAEVKVDWWLLGYKAVGGILLLHLSLSLFHIVRMVKKYRVQQLQKIRFVNTAEKGTPFSFLNYIFWDQNIALDSETGQHIFRQELVHVEEKHTLDKLFMQVILILFWCIPFFWLIKRELKFIHEFIADKKAVAQDGLSTFAAAILQKAFPQQYHVLTNQFFQTSIKRRLAMLTQVKNPKTAYISRLLALPLVAFTVFAFTIRTKAEGPEDKLKDRIQTEATDTVPKSAKGVSSINVRKKEGLKDGEVEVYYVDGRREVLTVKDANAKGLITIRDVTITDSTSPSKTTGSFHFNDAKNSPLFIVDGKIVSREELEKINPQAIERVNVIKDDAAAALYGEKGKNGVVEIKLKKGLNGNTIVLQQDGKPVAEGTITKLDISASDIKVEADEITVVGRKLENEPVFVKSEFPPTVDKDEWRNFISKHLNPVATSMAQKGAFAGTYEVLMEFIVEKDGSLSNLKIVKSAGYELDKKVLEIMNDSPKWKPAIQNGRAVRAVYKQPIQVNISDSKGVNSSDTN